MWPSCEENRTHAGWLCPPGVPGRRRPSASKDQGRLALSKCTTDARALKYVLGTAGVGGAPWFPLLGVAVPGHSAVGCGVGEVCRWWGCRADRTPKSRDISAHSRLAHLGQTLIVHQMLAHFPITEMDSAPACFWNQSSAVWFAEEREPRTWFPQFLQRWLRCMQGEGGAPTAGPGYSLPSPITSAGSGVTAGWSPRPNLALEALDRPSSFYPELLAQDLT